MVMYSIPTTVKTHTKKKIEKLNSKYVEIYIARWMLKSVVQYVSVHIHTKSEKQLNVHYVILNAVLIVSRLIQNQVGTSCA
jgi:hypothetical protein